MHRPRDSQRSRLYKAERTVPPGARFDSLGACQARVEQTLASPWWRGRFPAIRSVTVHDGRGRRHAAAIQRQRVIKLPRWSRTELLLLHELAHIGTPERFAGHGPEYARAYLELVRQFMAPHTAAELEAAFRLHRVEVAPANTFAALGKLQSWRKIVEAVQLRLSK